MDSITASSLPWTVWLGDYGEEARPWCLLEDGGRLLLQSPDGARLELASSDTGLRLTNGEAIARGEDPPGSALWIDGRRLPRCVPAPGEEYRVPPVSNLAELKRRAEREAASVALGTAADADLVDVETIDPRLRLDLRYATERNFVGAPVYSAACCLVQRPAAEALGKVVAALAEEGLGLLIYDAYRPWRVTWLFRQVTPPAQHRYVADPAKGSRHNRGCAIDLTLCDLESGRLLEMPSGFDEFSRRAHADYPGGTTEQRAHRARLRAAMEAAGFEKNPWEWWHFDHPAWERYPLLDLPL